MLSLANHLRYKLWYEKHVDRMFDNFTDEFEGEVTFSRNMYSTYDYHRNLVQLRFEQGNVYFYGSTITAAKWSVLRNLHPDIFRRLYRKGK